MQQGKDSLMDRVKGKGSFGDKIRRMWLSLPLRKKVGAITVLAAFAVSFSILMNLVTAGFGMNGFRKILEDNSRSASFQAAMETESRTFKTMIRNSHGNLHDFLHFLSPLVNSLFVKPAIPW